MKKLKMFFYTLFLPLIYGASLRDFNECTFEADECGWYSGSGAGVGGWERVTTQQMEEDSWAAHPSHDASGDKTGENGTGMTVYICVVLRPLHDRPCSCGGQP